jgi:two-component system sensor histidine kinase QseC
MKELFRPTLVRRVVLALLVGFPFAWVALTTKNLLQLWQQHEHDRKNFASSPVGLRLRDALTTVEDPSEARIVGAALDRVNNGSLRRDNAPGLLVIQIWDRREHHRVFSSADVANEVIHGSPAARTRDVVNGHTLQVFEVDTPRWSILWARSPIDIPWVVSALSGDLLFNMALAFPCLLLSAWLAVSHGLRPLRRFSQAIATRGPDDLSPLGVAPKHAEMKPVFAALDGMLAKLRRKIEDEQAFVANAAHELRTPLAVITAQAHVLAKATDGQERADAQLRLEAAIARASHLVHQLLALARMEMTRRSEAAPLDLAELVRREIGDFFPAACARNIEIALEAPDRLLVSLEVHPFRSILQNLLDNAIRYGREGGRIAVELRARGNALTLCVSDDGSGIANTERPRVFDRFYLGAQRDGAPGTGLGLTIVKQATTRLGGEVLVTEGLDGSGCCFKVEIGSVALVGTLGSLHRSLSHTGESIPQ